MIQLMMQKDLQKPAFLKKPGKHKGILDPIQAAQQFRLNRYLPAPDLAPFIEHHWIIRWDLRDKHPYVSEVIPYANINIAFMREGSRVTGVTPGKYAYEVQGAGTIVGAMFKPGAFYPFWRKPVSELTDKILSVSAVFSEADEQFNEAIISLEHDEEMVERVEALLRASKPHYDENITLINQIIGVIAAENAECSVGSIADRFSLSQRTLQYLFQTYVGVGLKWVIMRYRLQEAIELASAPDAPNWTRVAADLGYSSQSHFTNDFKKIVGRSPTQYAKVIRNANQGFLPDRAPTDRDFDTA
jgi:AraC-like DNA-binding protein